MRTRLTFAAAALAAAGLAGWPADAPAAAKVCKDAVTAKARSAAQLSDASRERRARENAIGNWKARVRDTYGWTYSFWSKAEERDTKCGAAPAPSTARRPQGHAGCGDTTYLRYCTNGARVATRS
jgi:hypothetical protein